MKNIFFNTRLTIILKCLVALCIMYAGCSKNNDSFPVEYNRLDFGPIDLVEVPSINFIQEEPPVPGFPIYSADRGFIFFGFDSNDVLTLSRFTPMMDMVWSHSFGVRQQFWFSNVKQTMDKGYILFGERQVTSNFNIIRESFAIKLDENGTIQWEKEYDKDLSGGCLDLLQLDNGEYIMTGYVGSSGYVRRIGIDGEEVWAHTFRGGTAATAFSVCTLPNNEFMINGVNDRDSYSEHIFVNISEEGLALNETTFGRINYNFEFRKSNKKKIARSQNGCIDVGSIEANDQPEDVLLTKIDATGNEEWTKIYGSDLAKNRVRQILWDSLNNEHLLSLVSRDDLTNEIDFILVKIDSNGDWLWGKRYEGIGFGNISIIPSEGYLFVGIKEDPSDNERKVFSFEIDANGNPI